MGGRGRAALRAGTPVGALPLALRALAISGVLVALMANLVMPLLGRVAERWLTRRA
jgi:antibiotic biosynthesis monooxygenase (ABM) superfamily enzyme